MDNVRRRRHEDVDRVSFQRLSPSQIPEDYCEGVEGDRFLRGPAAELRASAKMDIASRESGELRVEGLGLRAESQTEVSHESAESSHR